MAARLCLTLSCVLFNVALLVSGAPGIVERSSRDLDKVYALRTRLQQLQKQIHELEAEEEAQEATGTYREDDVSSKPYDVVRGHGGRESQMTSQRQKHAQRLAKELDAGSQRDMHELTETLRQLLRETSPGRSGAEETNGAGEYLGDKYNRRNDQLSKTHDDDSAEDQSEEEEREEEEEEGDEDEKRELEGIYNRLMRLYSGQQGDREEVETVPSAFHQLPAQETSARFSSPEFNTEEGTFGEFVDTDEESRPLAPLRKSVLSAIEKRLQEDLRDAKGVGISLDDLIQDMRDKVSQARSDKLRQIENELTRLTEREE